MVNHTIQDLEAFNIPEGLQSQITKCTMYCSCQHGMWLCSPLPPKKEYLVSNDCAHHFHWNNHNFEMPRPCLILPQHLNSNTHVICLWLLYTCSDNWKMVSKIVTLLGKMRSDVMPNSPPPPFWLQKNVILSNICDYDTLHPSLSRGHIFVTWVNEGWRSETFSNVKWDYLLLNLMTTIWSLTAPKPHSLELSALGCSSLRMYSANIA